MSGGALRVYGLVGMLGLGWALGRAPDLIADARAATPRAVAMPTPVVATRAQPFAPAAGLSAEQSAALAAQVASAVAAQVAQATVARLIAAGWGPPLPSRASPGPVRIEYARARHVKPAAAPVLALGYTMPAGAATAIASPALTTPAAPTPAADRAFASASLGYAALARGDRRDAARALTEAIATDPGAAQATAWRADLRRLESRWRVEAYSLLREGGGVAVAASPVLGAGQTAAALSFTPAPLARRPLSLILRVTGSHGARNRIDPAYNQGAVALRWQALPRVAIDVERRFGFGYLTRDDWATRISGGTDGRAMLAGRAVNWSGFAEAGAVGLRHTIYYAGGQARAATPLGDFSGMRLDAGAGVWGSAQGVARQGSATRLDVGPSVQLRSLRYPVTVQVDYRLRALGNARPVSGPAVTLGGQF